MTYTTIDDNARRRQPAGVPAQPGRGEAYSSEAPTLWDVDFRTAVAQAELEDREQPGAYHRISFHGPTATGRHRDHPARAAGRLRRAGGPPRRRALPAAVRHTVTTPLFGVEVPVLAHPLAEPDKGSGIAMICTFGDITDVIWWRELQLAHPRRSSAATAASSPSRRLALDSAEARGLRTIGWPAQTVQAAQRAIVELLTRVGRPARRAAARSPTR